jgi:hypothetical protein
LGISVVKFDSQIRQGRKNRKELQANAARSKAEKQSSGEKTKCPALDGSPNDGS